MRERRPKALAGLAVAAALALAGCGGGEDETTATAETAAREGTTIKAAGERQSQKEQGGSPSGREKGQEGGTDSVAGAIDKSLSQTPPVRSGAQEGQKAAAPGVPTHRGGDNSVQTFGTEATATDRAEAATVLQTYLDARAAGEWAKACFFLAGPVRSELQRFAGGDEGGTSCVEAMKALTVGVPKSALRQGAKIDEVLSLRVEGDGAFLLFNGPPKTTLYLSPMARGDGDWKVAAITPSALPI